MEANKESIKISDSKREEELIKQIEQLEGRLAAYTDISNGKDAALIRLEKENERLKENCAELEREKEELKRKIEERGNENEALKKENELIKEENEALKNRKVVRLVDKTSRMVGSLSPKKQP